jgi:hypothetical protein
MASEFKVRNGLIVTGSLNVSESMYAPNLVTNSTESLYVTWRQSDGRLEISSGSSQIATQGCWDYEATSTPSSGSFTVGTTGGNPQSIGSSTSLIKIHYTDNSNTSQYPLLNNIGVGSVLSLSFSGNIIKFTVVGFSYVNADGYWQFNVRWLSGGVEATPGTIMCLAIGAAISGGGAGTSGAGSPSPAPANSTINTTCGSSNTVCYFIDVSVGGINGNSRTGGFLTGTSWVSPYGVINSNTVALKLANYGFGNSPTTAKSTAAILIYKIGLSTNTPKPITITWQNKQTVFNATLTSTQPTGIAYGGAYYLNLTYLSGDLNYTITGGTFSVSG